MRVYREFSVYISEDIEDRLVEWPTLSVARLDPWIASVMECFVKRESRYRYEQKCMRIH